MILPRRIALFSALLCVCLTLDLHAQTDYWQRAPGPYGGSSIADLERTADGRVYAATSSGVFVSEDEGATWSGFSEGLTNFDIRDIYQLSDGRLVVATFGSGLFRLDVSAQKWVASGLERTYVTSIIEPVAGHILVGGNGFVYDSSDNGQTWKSRSLDGYQVNVQDLAFNNTHLFAASSLGMFTSSDAGLTWQFASLGFEEYNILSVTTDASGTAFAGASPANGGCAMYRSRGNGNIWTCIQPASNPVLVPTLRVDGEGTIWVGGYQRIFKSQNQGDSWLTYAASKSTVQAITFSGSTTIIGTAGLGVLRSQNAGISWSDSNTGLQSKVQSITLGNNGKILVGTEGGLFESMDYGSSWGRVHPSAPLIQRITDADFDGQGRIIAATAAGVWRHTEGTGWEALGPPGMPSIRDLFIQEDGSILAAYYAGLYILNGSNWTPTRIIGPDQSTRDVSSIAVTASGTIMAGAAWDSWKKSPGIAPWELMSAGSVPWFDVQSFGLNGDHIYAGTRYLGILESTDEGTSWKKVGVGLTGTEDIRDIAVDNNGRVHIATYGSGIFQMNPWTKVWLAMNRGLENHLRVTSLSFDASGNGYAGTIDGGLYRHVISTSTESEPEPGIPGTFRIGKPYPNPATRQISIPVNLSGSARVSVRVFDVLGRQVHSDSASNPAAEWAFTMGVDALRPGMYFVSLQAGSHQETTSFVVIR